MRKLSYIWGFTVMVLFISCESKIPREIQDFTPQSEFIFIGTIQLKNSSTLLVDGIDDLAVVLVDKILFAPKIFNSWENNQITVQLKDLPNSKEGDKRLFFTRSWLFGEEIAVVEIGSYRTEKMDSDKLRSQINQVIKEEGEKILQERLSRASFVVLGTVKSVNKDPAYEPYVTEHDPIWLIAEINVENVLKGNIQGDTFKISFPGSDDIMWMDAPKPAEGQEGIWILHEKQPEGLQAPYPALLEKEDVLTKKDLELCQKLLKK